MHQYVIKSKIFNKYIKFILKLFNKVFPINSKRGVRKFPPSSNSAVHEMYISLPEIPKKQEISSCDITTNRAYAFNISMKDEAQSVLLAYKATAEKEAVALTLSKIRKAPSLNQFRVCSLRTVGAFVSLEKLR